MLDRVERLARRARRAVDRDVWTVRLLRLAPAAVTSAGSPAAGLLIVQIDGLARAELRRAVEAGHAPFLRSLLQDDSHALVPVYTGLPSVTPAVQAELFYGVRDAVPSFSFADRESGRIFRMYEAEAVRTVEGRLAVAAEAAHTRPLLREGGSYLNVYDAGATHARFCMASLGWGDVQVRHPVVLAAIAGMHLSGIVRSAGAVAVEAGRGVVDLAQGLRSGQHLASELKFVQSRVAIGVVLRELCAFGASLDLARGAPVVHVNLLGYDEMAHRRGPGHPRSLRAMRGVDATIRRLARRAERSTRRQYDVWVMSDHGQEPTRSYPEVFGRSVRDAVAEVAAAHGLEISPHDEPREGEQGIRARALGERAMRFLVPGLDITTQHRAADALTVVAQGPLGHVYLPAPLDTTRADAFARDLVERARVPLVLRAGDDAGEAVAYNRHGRFVLPADAAAVVGADHPYAGLVAVDLTRLVHHPDSGAFVLSGWSPDGSLSFTHENGAHAGPGPGETDAFVIVPADTPEVAVPRAGPCRYADVRRGALAVLGRDEPRPVPPRANTRTTIRIVTYNVHSCIGMDDVCSPERVARAIARHDPDVVLLQELDVNRVRTGGVDQAHEIARHLQMDLAFHPTIAVAEERFGDAVLSRLPMRVVRAGALPGFASPRLEPRGAIWVEVDAGGQRPLHVVNTHLSIHPRERRLQVDALLGPDWLGDPACGPDVLLAGDFNAPGGWPSCRAIERRLRDVQRARGDGRRAQRTWFGRVPVARIDHVFVAPHLEVAQVEVADDPLARVASDHRPLVVDLARDLRPSAADGH